MNVVDTAFCARFRTLIKAKNWTSKFIATSVGLNAKTIDRYRKAETSPTINIVIWIAREFPDISIDWLLLGRGEMLNDPESTALSISKSGGHIGDNTDEELQSLSSETRDSLVKYLIDENRRLAKINSALIERIQ